MNNETLSDREFEIIEQIALGASKKEVANKLNRSVYTVETTVKNAYEKLGISKISDLVLWYCGEVFDIAAQIAERKKEITSTLLVFIVVIHGYNDTEFRVRRYRRSGETEYALPISYLTEEK